MANQPNPYEPFKPPFTYAVHRHNKVGVILSAVLFDSEYRQALEVAPVPQAEEIIQHIVDLLNRDASQAQQPAAEEAAPIEHWRDGGKACDIEIPKDSREWMDAPMGPMQPSPAIDLEPVQKLIHCIRTSTLYQPIITAANMALPALCSLLAEINQLREENAKLKEASE